MSNLLRNPIVLSLLLLVITAIEEIFLFGIVAVTGFQIHAIGSIAAMGAAFLVGAIYYFNFKEFLPRKDKLKISLNAFLVLVLALAVVFAWNFNATADDPVPASVRVLILLAASLFFSTQIYLGLSIFGFVMRKKRTA